MTFSTNNGCIQKITCGTINMVRVCVKTLPTPSHKHGLCPPLGLSGLSVGRQCSGVLVFRVKSSSLEGSEVQLGNNQQPTQARSTWANFDKGHRLSAQVSSTWATWANFGLTLLPPKMSRRKKKEKTKKEEKKKRKGGAINMVRVLWPKAGDAFTQTWFMSAFRVSTGLHVEHRRPVLHMKVCSRSKGGGLGFRV